MGWMKRPRPDRFHEKALATCAMLTAFALLARALVELARTLWGP